MVRRREKMAARKKKEYEQKAITSKIAITSRASVKVKDNFYTVEYQEERLLPEDVDLDIEKERQLLWDTCNTEVDKQIEDIWSMMKK